MFRIRLNDPLNWVIEKYSPGGEVISRGKFVGKLTKEAWKIVGYYCNAKEAYQALLHKEITELTLNENKPIAEAIALAEKNVLELISKQNAFKETT